VQPPTSGKSPSGWRVVSKAKTEASSDRLEAMMAYAQTVHCRVRFLRDYFADQTGGRLRPLRQLRGK